MSAIDVLLYAARRAGIDIKVDTEVGGIVIRCSDHTAADLAERVLRTVPLRGPAHSETPDAMYRLPTWTAESVAAAVRTPPIAAGSPRVTFDDGLALVPREPATQTEDLHEWQEQQPLPCTCMANVLHCALHGSPRAKSQAQDKTLAQTSILATQPEQHTESGITDQGGR